MTEIYITACGKKDGVGSQILSKILAIMFCKKNNFKYVHSPLQILDYKNQDPFGEKSYRIGKGDEYVKSWENFLNIGEGFFKINEINKPRIDLLNGITTKQITMKDNYLWHDFDPLKPIKNCNKKDVLYLVKEFPKINFYESKLCEEVLDKLKINYLKTSKPKLLFNKNKFNIVFHKRHTGPYTLKKNTNFKDLNCRVTLNTYYIDLLLELNNKYKNENIHKNENIQFWIFSDGDKSYFPEYEFIQENIAYIKNHPSIKINMMLRSHPQETFHHFVNADILILDKSSFGYVAGLYNSNLVIYNPYWDKQYSKWILKEDFINI